MASGERRWCPLRPLAHLSLVSGRLTNPSFVHPMQNEKDSRQIFTFVDPSLGIPLPERDYAADCRVLTPESEIHPMENIYVRHNFVFTRSFPSEYFKR